MLAAAILWGTIGTAQAFGPDSAQPAAIGALRLLFGGLALLAVAIFRGSLRPDKPWPKGWTLLSAGCVAAYQVCFFASVRISGVATGTVVAIGSAPILAGILAWVIRRERLSSRWMTSTALAILGCTLMIGSQNDQGVVHLTGIVLALGAGLSYAAYTVTTKRILENQAPEAVVAIVFSLGALILLPILFKSNLEWLAQENGIAVVLHLSLIATTLAYILFARGLQLIPVSTAVSLSLAEPLTATILGIFILKESFSWFSLLGMALLFLGLVFLTSNPSRTAVRVRDPSSS